MARSEVGNARNGNFRLSTRGKLSTFFAVVVELSWVHSLNPFSAPLDAQPNLTWTSSHRPRSWLRAWKRFFFPKKKKLSNLQMFFLYCARSLSACVFAQLLFSLNFFRFIPERWADSSHWTRETTRETGGQMFSIWKGVKMTQSINVTKEREDEQGRTRFQRVTSCSPENSAEFVSFRFFSMSMPKKREISTLLFSRIFSTLFELSSTLLTAHLYIMFSEHSREKTVKFSCDITTKPKPIKSFPSTLNVNTIYITSTHTHASVYSRSRLVLLSFIWFWYYKFHYTLTQWIIHPEWELEILFYVCHFSAATYTHFLPPLKCSFHDSLNELSSRQKHHCKP